MVKGLSARMRFANQKLVAMQSALDWMKQTQGGQLSRHFLQDTQRLLQALALVCQDQKLPCSGLKVQELVERKVGTHSVPWNSLLRALASSGLIELDDADNFNSLDLKGIDSLSEELAQSSLSLWKNPLSPSAEAALESLASWVSRSPSASFLDLKASDVPNVFGNSDGFDAEWIQLGLEELESNGLILKIENDHRQIEVETFLSRYRFLRFLSDLGISGLFPEKSNP
jgi:hypothetical protein